MAEFSDWFEDTFKKCYCEQGNLIDEARFKELVQLVLDNEADDESLLLFEKKIKSCVKSKFPCEAEKSMREEIKTKLCEHKSEIPSDLAQIIRKSVNI